MADAHQSRATFEATLADAQKLGDASAEGRARCDLARLDAHAGDWDRALEGFAEAKRCAVRAHDDALMHLVLANESFHGSELHDAEEQLVLLERAASFFKASGDERESLHWTVQLARAYCDFDRQEKARTHADDALARARAIDARDTEGFALFALGGVSMSRGELDEAAVSYRGAIDILGDVGKERDRGYALGYLGVVLHLRMRFDEAEAAYAAGCVALSAIGDAPNAAIFSLFRAGLAADRDDVDEADARFESKIASIEGWIGNGMRPVVAATLHALIDAGHAREAFRKNDLTMFVAKKRAAEKCLDAALVKPERIISAKKIYDWRDVSLDLRVAYRLAKRAVDALMLISLPDPHLVIDESGGRFRHANSEWIDLGGRKVLRRILAKLVEARLSSSRDSVSAEALIEAGWPGEHIAANAANNRLHVALGTLRRMGLGDLLEHEGAGWRLSPDVPILRACEEIEVVTGPRK